MRLSLLLPCLAVALLSSPALGEDSMDRLREEVSAKGEIREAPDLAEKEAAARAGLAKHLSDALVDIMAMILHGSDSAKDAGIERLAQFAINTNENGREQARMFRSAVVAGGALPAILAVLESTEEKRQFLAASAIHTLAVDDPTTDEDNFIAPEICQTGAVPPLVKLLSAKHEGVQSAATAALSSLAESPVCAQMIAAAGAIEPLMMMTQYGGDFHKLGALNTLDVLETTSPQARKEIRNAGAADVLKGISTMGSGLIRDEAGVFSAKLNAEQKQMSDGERVAAARKVRMRYDKVRHKAFQMMQGWEGRGGGGGGGGGRGQPQ